MSFPSSHLIYHPILANNNTNVQQMPLQQPTQQQVHNLHNLFQQPQQQAKPIHVKVLVFETKKEDLSALETLKPTSIRRSERVLSNYADLTKYLTEKCGLTLENALIRYQDDENHWVDISSDEELAYGIQLCRDSRTSAIRSIFRVAVILLKKEEEKPKQPEEEKRECPYWKGRRHGGCPFRRPRHNISENHPFMFRKTLDGENVLEVDIDVERLKNGLNVNEFVRENIDKVQIPHFGVTCDGCGKYAFVGKRFKCDDCDDFDFCEDCFASENVRNAHCGGSHSFTEQQPRSACFLRNIFGAEKKEEETVIDNQLYEEQQPVVVEQPIVAEEQQPVVVEEPVVVPEPINVFQIPHPLNPVQQPIIEEPVVVQQPPIVQQPTPYQTELALLRDMGFVDEISNLALLNKYNGDLQRVIVDLIH